MLRKVVICYLMMTCFVSIVHSMPFWMYSYYPCAPFLKPELCEKACKAKNKKYYGRCDKKECRCWVTLLPGRPNYPIFEND
ncbi:hypothetical protein DICVIV_07887 [Dictyocaulus viviparus]|uniref:Uncharacterized protein n=1 Tax=Dictyocaulus viviparus TaxID=29172 RepID=A0A0D8XQK8_DICVI|nr:hypothetical protein DICVIV_07887 [Dictyocaulus viviparus]